MKYAVASSTSTPSTGRRAAGAPSAPTYVERLARGPAPARGRAAAPAHTATTVRVALAGEVTLFDGPFAETRARCSPASTSSMRAT